MQIPETLTFFLLMLVIVAISLAGLFLVRRTVSRERLSRHTDVAGYVYAVVGVIYGVILAQVVVAGWDDFSEAHTYAASEASAVLNLNRLARTWPDEQRAPVDAALLHYAQQVVEVEWPEMQAGNNTRAMEPGLLNALWSAYDAAARGPVAESASYAASLDQLDSLDEARRNRFLADDSRLPTTMLLTLLVGGAVTVGFSYLFAIEDGWMHGLLTGSLALMLSLLLLLEFQLESPFTGIDAIEPVAMQMVLDELQRAGT